MRRRSCGLIATAALLTLGLSACVTPAQRQSDRPSLTRTAQQPMRDLSIIRDELPPPLIAARKAPYATSPSDACPSLLSEIAGLDEVLGPDISGDSKPDSGFSADGLAIGLVGDAIGLPFRGVVRKVTGAEQRDREIRMAVLAGMVRRAFLKGRAHQFGCEIPAASTATAESR